MIAYRKCESVFTKVEREWRVEPDALVMRDEEGRETRLPWRDVAFVRMQYAPTRVKMERYVFQIAAKRGPRFSIDNMHYAGFADFRNRSSSYTPFVQAVLDKVKEAAPQAAVYLGATPASYIAQVAFVTIAFAAFAGLFLVIPVFEVMSDVSWMKMVLVLLALPFFFRWVYTAYPRKAKLGELPEYVLPKVTDET